MSRRLDDKRRIEYVEHFLLKLKPVLILVFMTGIDRSTAVHIGVHSYPAFNCGIKIRACIVSQT
jgi:hypothetical protein